MKIIRAVLLLTAVALAACGAPEAPQAASHVRAVSYLPHDHFAPQRLPQPPARATRGLARKPLRHAEATSHHHARSAARVPHGSIWDALAQCESGGRWDYNGSSGYDGGLQFAPSTWSRKKFAGYPAYAWQATREQQIAVAKKILAESGWGQWPACSRKLHLR